MFPCLAILTPQLAATIEAAVEIFKVFNMSPPVPQVSTVLADELIFNDFDLSSYIGLLRASVLASGIIFELPIIIYFLTRVGIVSPEFLKKNRKISLVVVLSLSAIITPPDVVSQIIVSIPILILYEVSIIIAKIVTRNQDKALTNV